MNEVDICVIIPTLNEEESIEEVISRLPLEIEGKKVFPLVIDGGSTDNTVNIARKAGAKVIFQKKKGKGSAMMEAVDFIDSEIYVFIDGDGTYLPEELPLLVKPILEDKADMVMGSRILGNSEKGAITRFNLIGNKLFNLVVRIAFGANITDMLTGYRVLNRECIKSMILLSKGFEIETEMTIEALQNDFRVIELPITYKRRKGETKLNPIKDGFKILNMILFAIRDTRPILFFGSLGAFLILIGLFPSFYVIREKILFGEVIHLPSAIYATLLILTGIQIMVFGLLADLSIKNRKRLGKQFLRKLGES